MDSFFYTITDTADVFWYYFGKVIPLKRLQITDNELVRLYQFWNDTLGLFSESSEEGYTYNLVGCVINGIAYGDTNKPTAIEDKDISVSDFQLFQNYPNPFNPTTRITYYLPNSETVKITVFNLLVKELMYCWMNINTLGNMM